MITISIFVISGLFIIALIATKKWEERRDGSFFILRAISRGDTHIRELHHSTAHLYANGKEKLIFFCNRQIPIHSKNLFNKLNSFLGEKRDQFANNMRDSRLLKKSDGISEFFKNISDVEKGNGQIHDIYEEGSQIAEEEVK